MVKVDEQLQIVHNNDKVSVNRNSYLFELKVSILYNTYLAVKQNEMKLLRFFFKQNKRKLEN